MSKGLRVVDDAYLQRLNDAGNGDGGGGGSDMLAQRVEALEHRVGKVEDKLDRVSHDVAEVKGKLTHMPTTITYVLMTFAIMAGTLGIARLVFMWTQ